MGVLAPTPLTSYADDYLALESSSNIEELERNLSAAMEAIGSWADDVNLTISTDKTTVTLFTSDPHQSRLHPVVSLHQIGLPLEKFRRFWVSSLTPTSPSAATPEPSLSELPRGLVS